MREAIRETLYVTAGRSLGLTRRLGLGLVWLGAAVAVPALLHPLGLGPRLLPMHVPILLASATLGPGVGALAGVLAPWISHLLTGMPPALPPVAPLMSLELMTYGAATGLLRQALVRRGLGRSFLGVYLWLVPGLALGRLVLLAAASLVGLPLGLGAAPGAYVLDALTQGLPGIALQLVLIPLAVQATERRGTPGGAGSSR